MCGRAPPVTGNLIRSCVPAFDAMDAPCLSKYINTDRHTHLQTEYSRSNWGGGGSSCQLEAFAGILHRSDWHIRERFHRWWHLQTPIPLSISSGYHNCHLTQKLDVRRGLITSVLCIAHCAILCRTVLRCAVLRCGVLSMCWDRSLATYTACAVPCLFAMAVPCSSGPVFASAGRHVHALT